MEKHMQYKTIVLALLQQRPEMHEQLRKERKLLTMLEIYAKELKESHEYLTDLLSATPRCDPIQIANEAMEMAIKQLEDRLPPVTPGHEALTLDEAMLFLNRRTPRG
jgi:hypothetical protein